MLTAGFANLELDTKVRRLAQFFDYNLLDHVPKFDGFYSLDLKEFSELLQLVYGRTNEVPAKLQDFLGISLICTPTNIVSWIQRPNFLPLVTAGQRPIFADAAATKAALWGSSFEPEQTVYLPLEARGEVRVNAPAIAKAAVSQFSSHWLAIDVQADAPAMVVISQVFYHPWHAYVDGKAVPLWRANHAFQALEVPLGTHQITLVYEDKAFLWGAIITLGSLFACVWLWLAGRGRESSGSLSNSMGQ
jgi:hypothetical protein